MRKTLAFTAVCALLGCGVFALRPVSASDHADTQELVANPATDISDVYIFPSQDNPNNVVVAMMVNPLIGRGASGSARFDPNVLYQFKFDLNDDGTEDRVIQVMIENDGPNQKVKVAGPVVPGTVGTTNLPLQFYTTTGATNTTFSPTPGMKVFAGPREDPFFFDLEQFFTILPDRGVPPGFTTPPANPNQPMATTWRSPGNAVDFLSNGGFNVMAIVIELPKASLLN